MDALCWMDIETTGLDPKTDQIIELYVEITDFNFATLYAFHAWIDTDIERENLHPVVYNMHKDSGLFDNMDQIPMEDTYSYKGFAELDRDFSGHLDFVKKAHDIDVLYPAGSSVHFDMSFLKGIGLPLTMKYLSHRHFDVTTLKLFMMTQTGFFPEIPDIEPKHRAVSDVASSINAARIICAPMADTSLKAAHVAKVIENA